jgi:hypothetical protein
MSVIRTAVLPLDSPATSTVVSIMNGRLRQLTSAISADAFQYAAENAVELDEQYELQGRTLWVGSASHSDAYGPIGEFRLGLWQGSRHALLAHVYDETSDDLLAIYDRFNLEDTTDGIVARPKRPRDTAFKEGATVTRGVRRLGAVDLFQLTGSRLELLPNKPGLRTPQGELFRQPRMDGSSVLVLVGGDFIAQVIPDPDVEEDEYLDNLVTSEYEWRPSVGL